MGEKIQTTNGNQKVPLVLIEDDPAAQETLKDILEENSYSVRAFASGKKALESIAHQTGSLVLADILLPDLDGLKVLQLIKEVDPDSAVIMMTGNTSLQTAIDAVNKGAYAYILKPINMDELKVLLKKATREIRLSKENKKLVDNLQLTNRDLEATNRRLSALNEEMDSILHIVSHDLRGPLINIQGFSTKLFGLVDTVQTETYDKRSEELSTCVRFIHKGVEKMDTLISGLLKVSRIGRKADPLQDNDLDKMIEDVRAVFDYQIKEQAIKFIKKNKFPTVWCRKNEMNQVFSNLISNAISYMGNKPAKEIEVGFEEAFDNFKFWVKDTGVGIEKKDQERIFKLFERLAEVPAKGEGLGLSLVKKIIQRHDGKIWVESYKGGGSTFYFILPKQRILDVE